ncbi:MAG: hypothetical protein ACXV7J_14995 [Methylomonas sp.]
MDDQVKIDSVGLTLNVNAYLCGVENEDVRSYWQEVGLAEQAQDAIEW